MNWRDSAATFLTRHKRGSLVAWFLACGIALIGLALPLPYLQELQATDLELMLGMQQVIEPHFPETRVAVARVDVAAEKAARQAWPWSKETLARAVDAIAAAKPRAIVLACLYHEAPLLDVKADDPLGRAIARAGSVIVPARPGGATLGFEELVNLDGLTQQVRLWKSEAPTQLSWTAQALIAASGAADVDVTAHRLRAGALRVGARDGLFRVHPGLIGTIKQVSVAAALTGTLDAEDLRDRVVLIGVTVAAWPPVPLTPSRTASPVEVHALAIASGLRGMGLRRTAPWVTHLLMLLTLLYTVPIVYAPRGRRAIMIVKVATVLLMVPVLALHWASVEIDVARPIVMFLLALPATASLRLAERRGAAQQEAPAADVVMDEGDPADVMQDLVHRYLGDRFTEMQPIGHGGMGTVFRARCRRLDAEVALKVLHPPHARNRAVVERFFREYELGEKLVHPGFVRVFERGQAGLHYFTMELLPGATLADEIEQGRRLTWREAARLLADVAAPLRYAHGLGVYHRDLKPGNVMRMASGGVKVLDLGVARVQELSALTGSGEVMGTLRYMAPEQIEGQPASPAMDVFAAGVLAWEAATGELPFDPYDMTRRFRAPAGEPPPEALRALLVACVAPDPRDRPDNFGVVMAELNKFET